jgi:hypothetical protein
MIPSASPVHSAVATNSRPVPDVNIIATGRAAEVAVGEWKAKKRRS